MLQVPWRIELLGGLTARQGEHVITRFRTQKTAALLGLLAFKPGLTRSREVIVDMLWSDADPAAGRLSLRVALTSLRRQLEPPGIASGSVIRSDYGSIRIDSDAIRTDLADYERLVADARQARDSACRILNLEEAIRLYNGPLLSGLYEDWVIAEQARVADGHRANLAELVGLLRECGDVRRAIHFAHQLASIDPLNETAQRELIELYVLAGERTLGARQYDQFAARLQAELGERPSESLRQAVEGAPKQRSVPIQTAIRPPIRERKNRYSRQQISPLEPGPQRREVHIRLPVTFTRFFDRQDELAALKSMLASDNAMGFVTVTGPGGTGKTRLAIEAGRSWHAAGDGSVWFVPLADVVDASDLPAAISSAIGLTCQDEQMLDAIAERLSSTTALLILDNFEHIVDSGARIVRTLMERAPAARVLVTSRQRLNLDGERELPLQPLPVPAAPGTPERLAEFASVQLFTDRAQAIRPDFQVTQRNAASVATLCHRLEGIPLAIELAAGWAQALTPAQMIDRLDRRFELLVSRRRDSELRHRSLQAAVDGSYRQLGERLQQVLRRLSVFRGGFTIAAAAAVCHLSDTDALAAVADLQERSLLTTDIAAGERPETQEMRGRLLETIREYAADRLEEAERTDSLRRHSAFFADLARDARAGLHGPDQARWLKVAEQDHDNFRFALQVCSSESSLPADADMRSTGLGLAADLWRVWFHLGHAREMRSIIQRVLAVTPNEPSVTRARALLGTAVLAMFDRDCDSAESLACESLAVRRLLGDRDGEAESLNALGSIANIRGEMVRAMQFGEDALAIRRELGSPWAIANSLGNLAIYSEAIGDRGRARNLYAQALEMQREAGDDSGRCNSLLNLAGLAYLECRYAEAAIRYEEVITIARRGGLAADVANALKGCAETRREQGDLANAEAMLQEALSLFRDLGDRFGAAVSLRNLSAVVRCRGCLANARSCANESLDIFTSLVSSDEIALTLHELAMIADVAGERDCALLHARKALESADADLDGRPVARSIELLCALAAGRADPTAMCILLSAVDSWRISTANYRQPSLAGPYQRASAYLVDAIQGDARIDAENRGRELSLSEAAAMALEISL